MEDVADNLFHPDPYYRQGGDMVRLGGLTYAIEPSRPMGRRIRDVRVGDRALDPARRYKATGWASRSARPTDRRPGTSWPITCAASGACRLDPRPRVRVLA